MTLAGRAALVTGGSRGIGRAIAVALARDGADVAIGYRRDAEAAAQTVSEIEALGRRALAFAAPIEQREACDALVDAVVAAFGGVDLLVNNAGIASRGQSVEHSDPDELERVVRTHAFAPHRLCQRVLPHMKRAARGDIVMISSTATLRMGPGGAPYNMGKAAMEALALTLAKEVRHHGVHVNIVAPGLVDTEMGRRLVKGAANIDDIHSLDARSPFGRVCQPEDVANAVRFLVSEGASYLTGETIHVHGGGALPTGFA